MDFYRAPETMDLTPGVLPQFWKVVILPSGTTRWQVNSHGCIEISKTSLDTDECMYMVWRERNGAPGQSALKSANHVAKPPSIHHLISPMQSMHQLGRGFLLLVSSSPSPSALTLQSHTPCNREGGSLLNNCRSSHRVASSPLQNQTRKCHQPAPKST